MIVRGQPGMPDHREQEGLMRWILFWIFVGLFVVIVLATLGAVFLRYGDLREQERETLFTVFLVEIGVAVVALFYSLFRLKKPGNGGGDRVRLSLGELADVRRLVGKTAILSPSEQSGVSLEEVECNVLDDNGPFVPLAIPSSAYHVLVTVDARTTTYSGSFVVGTHLVDLSEDDA